MAFYRWVAISLLCVVGACRAPVPAAYEQAVKNRFPVQQASFVQNLVVEADETEADETEADEAKEESNSNEAEVTKPDSDEQADSTRRTESQVSPTDELGQLDYFVQTAIAVSPAIRKLVAEIGALQGKQCQAGLPPNPTIGLIGSEINDDGSAGRYGLFYGNTIVRGNKLRLAQDIVCNEIRQKENELAELQQRLVTDVKQHYYEILVAIEKSNLTVQLFSLSQNAVQATRQLLEAKEIARAALIQAELEMQNVQVQQQLAQNELAGARRSLAALIGESDLSCESFAGSLKESGEMTIEAQFDRLLSESPEIARLYSQVAVARSHLLRQQVEPIGNIQWQTNITYDFGSKDFVSGFQVGLPIPRLNRNQGAILQANQQIKVAEADVETRSLQLRQRLVQSFQAYQNAKIQVELYGTKVLPKARETLELVIQGFQQGEADFLQLLTAQRTYFQINLAVIEQQGAMWRHRIEIEGLLLNDSLNQ